MPHRYIDAILKYLANRSYLPLKPRQLARQLGVSEADYGTFRDAVKLLRDQGRVVMGAKNALMLPEMTNRVVGYFRPNPRGFGFVSPETPLAHGDLFIPPENVGGAMDGDLVVARVYQQGRREGKSVFAGEIVEILQRGSNRVVGTLQKQDAAWFVLPEGRRVLPPVVVRDISEASPAAGTKVVVELLDFGGHGKLPTGVIVETLGQQGKLEVETLAVMRSHGLPDRFEDSLLDAAAKSARSFDGDDPAQTAGRTDLTGETIVTIDPPDARDFDDAIGIVEHADGTMTLGVHIADVSHFVPEGGPVDAEARTRATSVYFPRKVVPMIPEVLSNGVCSLQEGVPRLCKSVKMTYNAKGRRVSAEVFESVIRSAKRLEYRQAQAVIDGSADGPDKLDKKVVRLLKRMDKLAKLIRQRRLRQGMLTLELPDVELVLDENHKVVDAVPEDNSFTHTIIEMFMVEANEAVGDVLTGLKQPYLRRIHPPPDAPGGKQFVSFVRACGHKIATDLTRKDIQDLLASVKGRPESYAVNLAILKLMQQAEYSPMEVGHFALASRNYCHFTSPIRRYPDLTVHRLIADYCRDRLKGPGPDTVAELTSLGEHCSTNERRAEAASRELREVMILEFLATKIGESFDGVITGVTNFGVFVQSPRFLIEGLVRMEQLGDDWWNVDAKTGRVRGERTGRSYHIGDVMPVRIAAVDLARRQLNLVPEKPKSKKEQEAKEPAATPSPEQQPQPERPAKPPRRAPGRRPGPGKRR